MKQMLMGIFLLLLGVWCYLFGVVDQAALFAVLGRLKNKVLRYAAKLLVFNAAMAGEVLLSVYALGVPFESFGILGPVGPILLLVLANAVFVVYDLALEGLIVQYLNRLHPRLGKILHGK